MKRFSIPIQTVIHPNTKYPYRLIHDVLIQGTSITGYPVKTEFIELDTEGNLKILTGYSWDGASGAIDTPSAILMSLVHDAFYQLMRTGMIPYGKRKLIDKFCLIVIARCSGMSCFRSFYVYTAVRVFGGRFAKEEMV